MKKKLAIALVTLMAAAAVAQKKDTPWTEWSKKDAEKVLTDSPWAKLQTDTDTSEMFYSPTNDPNLNNSRTTSTTGPRLGEGAKNSAISISFQVRFFSARPVRQALARMIEINNKPPADVSAKLHQFAELQSPDSIIVTVTFDSPDGRYAGKVLQAFNSANTAQLKNECYLQRSDGKQLFLEEYVPPGKDGFGARFIFLRQVDGAPFIKDPNGELRFYVKYPDGIKVDRRFKLSEMMYQGQLEL